MSAASSSNQRPNAAANIEQIRRELLALETSGDRGELKLVRDNATGVATLRISNPKLKNCFTGNMMAQLSDVLDELQAWTEVNICFFVWKFSYILSFLKGKIVIIYGEQGLFCSGGDLNTVRMLFDRSGGEKMITLMQHNLQRLQQLPQITMAYVCGWSLGGGCELMTACDYRLATPDARLGFVQVRVGITTLWGGGSRLVQLVGYNKALAMLATGQTMSAPEAERIGFVDQLMPLVEATTDADNEHNAVDQERRQVLASVSPFMNSFLKHPRETMLAAKQICLDARRLGPNIDEALARERLHALSVYAGPVHREVMKEKINHNKG